MYVQVVATYSKHHVLPIAESTWFSAGPFAPTSFDLVGHRFGILICYEGIWPLFPGNNWAQMDALKAQGADTFVWNVGAMVPIAHAGSITARRYNVSVLASADSSSMTGDDSGVALGPDGKPLSTQKDVAVPPPDSYTAKGLHIRLAVLPS